MSDDKLAELEAELARTRSRLAAKERELEDIHRSRAWSLLASLRTLKLRAVDPILGVFGVHWPRRAAATTTHSDPIEKARDDRYDVICLAPADWDGRFQRPQQLMSQFAAHGHRVFYVCPQFRGDGPPYVAARKRENVYEITLRGEPFNVHAEPPRDVTPMIAAFEAMHIESAVTIAYLPFWRALATRLKWPVIYDCIDLHSGFTTVRKAILDEEEKLLADADAVIVTSAALERHALRKRDDVEIIRNAADFAHFAKTPRAHNPRPVIGYYGAISDWFDASLVAALAERRRDWDFILIGSTYGADLSRLARQPNIALHGEEPYDALPECIGKFDVCIIPFQRTPLTEATNPVKLYEMLATGKPIVAVPLPEIAMLTPLVRLASTVEEFEREIEAALAHDEATAEARQAFARENTWQQRFEAMQRVIARVQ